MLGDEALLMKLMNGAGIPRLVDLQYPHVLQQFRHIFGLVNFSQATGHVACAF
jgi:hypothetical protein